MVSKPGVWRLCWVTGGECEPGLRSPIQPTFRLDKQGSGCEAGALLVKQGPALDWRRWLGSLSAVACSGQGRYL